MSSYVAPSNLPSNIPSTPAPTPSPAPTPTPTPGYIALGALRSEGQELAQLEEEGEEAGDPLAEQ